MLIHTILFNRLWRSRASHMATFLCSSRGNALWWWSGLFIFRVLLDHYRNIGGSHCCKTYEKLCSFHNGEWWYCFIQIKRLIIYSTCRWMCVIPVYDYGELKVLLFRLVADGRLQVKINGWDCCLEHLVWSKEFLPFLQELEHVSSYVLFCRLRTTQVWEFPENYRRCLF